MLGKKPSENPLITKIPVFKKTENAGQSLRNDQSAKIVSECTTEHLEIR